MKTRKNNIRRCRALILAATTLPLASFAAEISAIYQPSAIYWNVPSGYAEAELVVGGPASVHQLFEEGDSPEFVPTGEDGAALPDGFYSYQLILTPQAVAADQEALAAARAAEDREAYARLSEQMQQGEDYAYLTDSGEFTIENGLIEEYDLEQEETEARELAEAAEKQSVAEEVQE